MEEKELKYCKDCSCYNNENDFCDMLSVFLPGDMRPCSTMAPEHYFPWEPHYIEDINKYIEEHRVKEK